jgi:hypothetical protein
MSRKIIGIAICFTACFTAIITQAGAQGLDIGLMADCREHATRCQTAKPNCCRAFQYSVKPSGYQETQQFFTAGIPLLLQYHTTDAGVQWYFDGRRKGICAFQ